MNIILVGFCSATTLFVSQYWGVKDDRSIRHYSGISVLFSLGVAILFTASSILFPLQVVRLFNSDTGVITGGAAYMRMV